MTEWTKGWEKNNWKKADGKHCNCPSCPKQEHCPACKQQVCNSWHQQHKQDKEKQEKIYLQIIEKSEAFYEQCKWILHCSFKNRLFSLCFVFKNSVFETSSTVIHSLKTIKNKQKTPCTNKSNTCQNSHIIMQYCEILFAITLTSKQFFECISKFHLFVLSNQKK